MGGGDLENMAMPSARRRSAKPASGRLCLSNQQRTNPRAVESTTLGNVGAVVDPS